MPALPAVPKVVKISIKMALQADLDVLNHFFYQYTGTLSQADAQTWCNAINTAWGTDVQPSFVTEDSHVSTTLTDLTSATAPVATAAGSVSGSAASPGLAAGSAMVVSFHLARRYRGGHPRIYLAGLPAAALFTPQQWTAAEIAGITSDLTTFRAAVVSGTPAGAGSSSQVNVSYFQGFTNHTFPSGRTRPIPTLRATPLVDSVTGFTINPKVGSQRRRNTQSV